MAHWLDTYNRRRVGQAPGTYPIAYTMDPSRIKATVETPASYSLISAQQSIDRNASRALTADKKYKATGYPAELLQALQAAGFSGDLLGWVFALCYHESGGFSNTLSRKDNNPGSIMWFPGMQKGTWVAANKTYAIHFNTLDDFARQMYREMTKKSNPAGASSLQDFVHRLKLNGYMGSESEKSYYSKLASALSRLKNLAVTYRQTDDKIRKQAQPKPFHLPWYGWAAIALAGVFFLKGVTR